MKTSKFFSFASAGGFGTVFLLLVGVISLMLGGVFFPGYTLASNDGPLGQLMSECHQLPGRFSGCWEDLNSVGYSQGAAVPSVSYFLQWLLGPVVFSKLYAPLALLILGLGAWCYFRESGLAAPASLLGAAAAVLNSVFFSTACWGVAAQPIAAGFIFFSLAALADVTSRWRWLRVALAGLAVGMAVTEGADVGAIYSIYVAAFLVYQGMTLAGSPAKKLAVSFARLGVVVVCAGLLAAQAVSQLVATNIQGIAGARQEASVKTEHWDWATQWSLPKRETLSLIVPGLFGYRMDTPAGGEYWGSIGRAPAWDRYVAAGGEGLQPSGFKRYSGGGAYLGILVALVALWTALQSFRKADQVFDTFQRRIVWFWLGVAGVSLLLAFGRFAPFYRWVYALPYFSTIRNPVKFLNLVELAAVILFGYGLDGIWRKYMQPEPGFVAPRGSGQTGNLKPGRFEKRWIQICALILGASVAAWMFYAASRPHLENYLQSVQVSESKVRAIAAFSIRQVGWFILFFALCTGLLAFIFTGRFSGKRAGWGMGLLGLLLFVDLGRANQPWIVYWNYPEKYSSNPVIDLLRDKPYAHRVTLIPLLPPPGLLAFNGLYQLEWMQHQFPYYNIQSLDVVQLPRKPQDLEDFEQVFFPTNQLDLLRVLPRRWQLTNSRYLLGAAAFEEFLDRQLDPGRFRVLGRFAVRNKPGTFQAKPSEWTVEMASNGPIALYEFTGALPRAKLYSNWQVNTNGHATLEELAAENFDPEQLVLVNSSVPKPSSAAVTNGNAGRVEITDYTSKDVRLKAEAAVPSVLLLNDRYDPHWSVFLDHQPAPLLRCNFLMRGVYLDAGAHEVEFRFSDKGKSLYVSLAAIAAGILLLGFLMIAGNAQSRRPAQVVAPRSRSKRTVPAAARRSGTRAV